jgi:hypothetical protein
MTGARAFGEMLGSWSGITQLWLSPGEASQGSDTTATVALIARDTALSIAYTWAFNGAPHEVLILLVPEQSGQRVSAAWLDSWHLEHQMMHCTGTIEATGSVRIQGTYPAPPGPDWGGRIEIAPPRDGRLRWTMVNITPKGEEQLAVKAEFTRSIQGSP